MMMSTLRILSIELISVHYIARPESVSKLFGVNRVLERHTIAGHIYWLQR